ncbi:MAG TPA: 6,7-dimethyl-8-ribityllumazine synthase, partial [Pelobium sp.]|nr:6,7-dimethyl-8-ribityllumazine synthase [Pelobium sp.]
MASNLKNLSDFSHTIVPFAKPYKFGIIVAAWNAEVTGALYRGAYDSLIKYEVEENNIISVEVAGSYELIAGAD